MALTRAMLKGMGLTEEQVSAIIEEHTNVTSALKDQVKEYKADAEKLPEVQKELDKLKNDTSASDWESKYNTEHKAFEKYKSDIADKEKAASLKDAYKKLLTECKVSEKHINSVMRVTDFSKMKLTDNGELEGADELKKAVEKEWSDFIPTEETKGADVDNPPSEDHDSNGNGPSRAAELAARYHDSKYGKIKED